jgi:hypothetical protein
MSPASNYSQLKVGNYWIYEQFMLDQAGNSVSLGIFDSCFIEKDTLINNKQYFKYVKPEIFSPGEFDISFVRDSLDFIINSTGSKLFSSQDFTNTLDSNYILDRKDTIAFVKLAMVEKNVNVITTAGNFLTLNAKRTYKIYPNFGNSIKYRSTRYAENIGIVTETLPFYVSDDRYYENRLVRYHHK